MNGNSFDTAADALQNLIKRGYTADFSTLAKTQCRVYFNGHMSLPDEAFKIDGVYRFRIANAAKGE